jgi:hypothetical protein
MRSATRPRLALLALALLVPAGAGLAQDRSGTVEITPFGGAYIGGTLYRGSSTIFSDDVDVKPTGTYGLRLGVNVNRWFGLEAGFSTAKADIRGTGSGLFDTTSKLGELDVKQYELNGVFSFGRRKVIPYFTIGGGATTFKARVPQLETDNDTRFSANLGAGLKVFFNPHVAFRFDGRARSAYVDDSERCRESRYCDGYRRDDDRRWYTSGEVTGGLTFAF